ncbi:MAG TPA: FecR family protein [Chitinophagaceae bacterium]|nr:FecR family protein [Chitinophagaceae bacterium]
MFQEERFWLLVSLKLSGEASPEELIELDENIQQHPELIFRVETFTRLWNAKWQDKFAKKEEAFDRHLQRLSNHLSDPVLKYESSESFNEQPTVNATAKPFKKYRWFFWTGSVAASLLILWIIFYATASNQKNYKRIAENTITTKPGSKSNIQLPDGTQVWLNADSKLTYYENFLGKFREVQLTGEAYFDVTKDKDHPFIIHTKTMDIKVLGTAFNVRSYANEKITETALFRGSVEITLRNNADKKIILKPNEKITIHNTGVAPVSQKSLKEKDESLIIISPLHTASKDSGSIETLWIKDKLAFDDEPLEQVALKIERWYDIKVTITDDALKQGGYSGVFDNESLAEVMEALHLTGNFNYTIKKKEVIISH